MNRGSACAVGVTLLVLAASCATRVLPSSLGPANPPEPDAIGQVFSTEPWRYAGANGSVIRTAHYRIFTTTRASWLLDRAPGFLEHALTHYRSALGSLPLPAARLDTYILANRFQWNTLTKQLMSDQAPVLLRIPRGGYASRGIGVYYDIGLFDTLAIAAHEGWHQYSQRAFREGLPIWIEEGIAAYMEGHRWDGPTPRFLPWANIQRFDALRSAYTKAGASHESLLDLPALLNARPTDFLDAANDGVLTYYAQLWALVHFLNEGSGGRYAAPLRALLFDAASGALRRTVSKRLGAGATGGLLNRVGPEVFLAYFNTDLDAADREYRSFLDQIVRTGARDAVSVGVSPLENLHTPQ